MEELENVTPDVVMDLIEEKAKIIGYNDCRIDVMNAIINILKKHAILHEGVLCIPADKLREALNDL